LTGRLDDGTAGLWAIKDRGGIATVQSPAEAAHPSMPRSALEHVRVDYTLPLADIPNILRSLTRERIEIKDRGMDDKLHIETRISLEENALERVRALGAPSFYTCPDCGGSMVAIEEGSIRRFRCYTGHAYSERALADQTLPKLEQTLSPALAQAEERVTLLIELAHQANSQPDAAAAYAREADDLRRFIQKTRALTREPLFDRTARAGN
jgi:two-component system chemotaxis response regulator CheB